MAWKIKTCISVSRRENNQNYICIHCCCCSYDSPDLEGKRHRSKSGPLGFHVEAWSSEEKVNKKEVLLQAQGLSLAEQEKNHYALRSSQVVLEKTCSLLSRVAHK